MNTTPIVLDITPDEVDAIKSLISGHRYRRILPADGAVSVHARSLELKLLAAQGKSVRLSIAKNDAHKMNIAGVGEREDLEPAIRRISGN